MTYVQRISRSILTLTVAATVFVPAVASAGVADTIQQGLTSTAKNAQYDTTNADLPTIVGKLIGQLLSLVGVILLVYFIYGGFLWMTAAGDQKKVQSAQGILRDAVIGLIIILSAYALTNFVFSNVLGPAFGSSTAASGVTPK